MIDRAPASLRILFPSTRHLASPGIIFKPEAILRDLIGNEVSYYEMK